MNGLTLRISTNRAKSKPLGLGISPVEFPMSVKETLCENIYFSIFSTGTTADEQLVSLKKIIGSNQSDDDDYIKFLVVTYLHAEPKHPVKCFVTRHIIKNTNLQSAFSKSLASEIEKNVKTLLECLSYKNHEKIVVKIVSCSENFPAGAAALKTIEMLLEYYLNYVLECCITELSNNKHLSPTEKNEIFNVSHLALRAILTIVQKVDPMNKDELIQRFTKLRTCLVHLFSNDDVPMDAKSVCGILYLQMHLLEYGPASWVDFVNKDQSDDGISGLLTHEAAQLTLYSAIITTVPAEVLRSVLVEDEPAILLLSRKIMGIGERNTSESSFVLGVTRTLLQLSKMLEKVDDADLGGDLVQLYLLFVWGHLEHHMDSVRHLTAQTLDAVVRYCTKLEKRGLPSAVDDLLRSVLSLSKTRKAYYVSVCCLARELGARGVLQRVPTPIHTLMEGLHCQPVQASATVALESLLKQHVREAPASVICEEWVTPILQHIASDSAHSAVLNVLEGLLAKAVHHYSSIIDFILPRIEALNSVNSTSCMQPGELKCILVLLNVTRKSGTIVNLQSYRNESYWKGIVHYNVLKNAAIDKSDETRILSLSLIVDTPKSTDKFSEGDFDLILHFLEHNINTQSPNFRQQMLCLLKKCMKRTEDSYKVLKRAMEVNAGKVRYYVRFLEELRSQCFASLLPGANYSRRLLSLQVLAWSQLLNLEGYIRLWKEEYVAKLLLHLEDSYEGNKSLALQILETCPLELLRDKQYKTSMKLTDILAQASSVKPTDCDSAAYKLMLLKRKIPPLIEPECLSDIPEAIDYHLLSVLLEKLLEELDVARSSILVAASHAPMYGLLHCMCHLMKEVDRSAIASSNHWTRLIDRIVHTSIEINRVVGPVVNNSSPEGHLPMDFEPGAKHLEGNGLLLEDGSKVTAQMVLLCAWRSVKEVSLLLGEISDKIVLNDHGASQLLGIGDHFTTLLVETKHRGAFEQAYVGFTKLLARLWVCMHDVPLRWLQGLLRRLAEGEDAGDCTRRGAGLPFLVQALVTTELEVSVNPSCLHECMSTLLGAVGGREGGGRAQCLNVLRALYRHAALGESGAGHVGAGVVVAVQGVADNCWPVRNSSTLLLSALMVRVFGVQRGRDCERLAVRNRMTGRIFFLRYPQLYDFMLHKLKSSNIDVGDASLFAVLLILARLYPSALEGTISNLKLESFVPLVVRCAESASTKARRLAARALVPLVSPQRYILQLESLFCTISKQDIKRNYCHGILLQIMKLLEARPDEIQINENINSRFMRKVEDTFWILQQGLSPMPCWPLIHEYVQIINLIIWKFPAFLNRDLVTKIENVLERLMLNEKPKISHPGQDVCLGHVISLYIIMLSKYDKDRLIESIIRSLKHHSYEVIVSVLDYILLLHNHYDTEDLNNFHTHCLENDSNRDILIELQNDRQYINGLFEIYKTSQYLECTQKSLTILSLERDTHKKIIEVKCQENNMADTNIVNKFIECIFNEHENLMHIYLKCLLDFSTEKLKNKQMDEEVILTVLRTVYDCSSSDNSDATRLVVAQFMNENHTDILNFQFINLDQCQIFWCWSLSLTTLATLLHDEEAAIRVLSAYFIQTLMGVSLPSDRRVAALLLLALMDFRCDVGRQDDEEDECRVFGANEKYNIYLEETVWSVDCMKRVIKIHHEDMNSENLRSCILAIVDDPVYIYSFNKLCNNNFKSFKALMNGVQLNADFVNPKVEIVVDMIP